MLQAPVNLLQCLRHCGTIWELWGDRQNYWDTKSAENWKSLGTLAADLMHLVTRKPSDEVPDAILTRSDQYIRESWALVDATLHPLLGPTVEDRHRARGLQKDGKEEKETLKKRKGMPGLTSFLWILQLLLVLAAKGLGIFFFMLNDPMKNNPGKHRGHKWLFGFLLDYHAAIDNLNTRERNPAN